SRTLQRQRNHSLRHYQCQIREMLRGLQILRAIFTLQDKCTLLSSEKSEANRCRSQRGGEKRGRIFRHRRQRQVLKQEKRMDGNFKSDRRVAGNRHISLRLSGYYRYGESE